MPKPSCRDSAVKILAVKDRTEKELRDKLLEKGYGADEADDAVEAMKGFGYIDDRAYAEKYVSDGVKLRGHGEARIRSELLRRGVSRSIVDETLAQGLAADGAERVAEIMDRRFQGADLSNPKERSRIVAYFARRGFSYSDIRGAMNARSAFQDIEWED